jgi:hypothetical protein
MQHWIEFLPQARALLGAIILTARAVLVIRALRPSVPTSTTKSDAATPAPTPSASTTGVAKCNSTPSTPVVAHGACDLAVCTDHGDRARPDRLDELDRAGRTTTP